VSRFRAVEELRADYTVERLCRVLEISTSGYHAWKQRPPSARQLADAELLVKVRQIHADSRRTSGAPRVHRQLRRRGVRVAASAWPG
jgi:putative transposase